uniref:Uncharacterized protein n=1 Tax=Daphnia magna TaxID=35525 RepID=A0A0P6JJD4_9CRUS
MIEFAIIEVYWCVSSILIPYLHNLLVWRIFAMILVKGSQMMNMRRHTMNTMNPIIDRMRIFNVSNHENMVPIRLSCFSDITMSETDFESDSCIRPT